jgi:hypothetical protein
MGTATSNTKLETTARPIHRLERVQATRMAGIYSLAIKKLKNKLFLFYAFSFFDCSTL